MTSALLKRVKLLSTVMQTVIRHSGGIHGSVGKAFRIARSEGLSGITRRFGVLNRLTSHSTNYTIWVQRYDSLTPDKIEAIKTRIGVMRDHPVISIIMPVYNPPLTYLEAAIYSVRHQLYPHWELCIADDASPNPRIRQLLQRHADEDARIRIVFRPENGHISAASNSALDLATGSFTGLLDHDDILPRHALFHVAVEIAKRPSVGLIYSDEDKIDKLDARTDAYFKPDWNPELFLSQNFISHFGVYKTALLREIGGFRVGYEGSQDYDLALRATEKLDDADIVHIPRVLYHWRIHSESTAASGDAKPYAVIAGERALNDHLQRRGIKASVTSVGHGYRARYALPDPAPLVSIVIPTRNRHDLVRQCIDSIVTKTLYRPYEIILVDNGSDDPDSLRYFSELAAAGTIRLLRDDGPFNYPDINNNAVDHAAGSVICLLNNDTEVITPDWLGEMVSFAVRDDIGAVGARLWYPDETLQHAGVVVGMGGVAGHAHLRKRDNGYFNRAHLIQNFSAVTAACLVIQKSIYQEVGGLDPLLAIAFNDIDFCLRVRDRGYRNVWTPFAELVHYESISRGYEETPEKYARFRRECQLMLDRWGHAMTHDPAYNPNLTLDHGDFSLAWPPRGEMVAEDRG